MQLDTPWLPLRRVFITAALGLMLLFAGCNGSGSSVFGPGGLTGNSAQVRFVNGSPDAGPVQVSIDNQQQFCTNGQTGSACAISYGQITTFAVNVSAGTHAVVIRDNSGNQITIPAFSGALSVNAGSRYSLVLAGEVHPTYTSGSTLTMVTITEQPFNSGPAVNFHQTSAYVQSVNGSGGVQFGYYTGSSPSSNPLSQPAAFGSETTPQTLPSNAQNVPITFYAISPTSGFTVTPNQISSSCSSNAMPCSTGNLSLYLIDGPAATTTPPAVVPPGVNPSHLGVFVGVFD
jgi:Domain of unknown function (DUF4397)